MEYASLVYAHYLGLEVEDDSPDSELLWIAKEALDSKGLPKGWEVAWDEEGENEYVPFFHNTETDESSWLHPEENKYFTMVENERRKLKEERREKQRKKGEEAFRQIIYEGIYIEEKTTEEEEYKITESDVQDLKEKFFDLPIKGAIPQEVFSLLGAAKYVGPSNSNVKKELKKIQKVNVDLDRDLELEAMLNIKYRHNVSQKILLNKQDNLLDTFINTYNQELSKDELAKLKKVSEDKKLNYFQVLSINFH